MWLSEHRMRKEKEPDAKTGSVTLTGNDMGVYSGGELRGVKLYSPGGYIWRPKRGDEVLVIKCAGGENIAVGVKQSVSENVLDAGEVCIETERAAIHIKNNGDISIEGNVNITGGLRVNGNEVN